MPKKYLLLYLIALLILSGCIELPQTQAGKVGWDETRYEMYSKLYNSIYEYKYDSSPVYTIAGMEQRRIAIQAKLFKIDDERKELKLYEITEFEETWGLAFLSYKVGLVAVNISYDKQVPLKDGTLKDTPEAKEWRDKAKFSFNQSAEYRQKIEDMKANLSR